MKIRNGFVSNSSSSSFVLYGVSIDSELAPAKLAKYMLKNCPKEYAKAVKESVGMFEGDKEKMTEALMNPGDKKYFKSKMVRTCEHAIATETVKFCPECGKPSWTEVSELDEDDYNEILYEITQAFDFGDSGIIYQTGEGGTFIGRDYEHIPDDMRFGDFKKQTQEMVSDILGKKVKCSHIEEVVYN